MACRTPAPGIPPALANWQDLPDDAHVRVDVVAALFACSTNTIWRRSKQPGGDLPAPVRLSPGVTAWNVGALRRRLAGMVVA